MDKKKIIQITAGTVIALALLALLVLWIAVKVKENRAYGNSEKKKNGDTAATEDSNGGGIPDFPLKWGSGTSRNKNKKEVQSYVRNVQILCNNWDGAGIAVDGIWGDNTEAAVQRLKNVAVKPKGNTSAFNIEHPFWQFIANVQVPLSSNSKVQIFVSSYNEMIAWNKANKDKYVRL